MWALLPLKRLEQAKLRLAAVLTPEQRRQLGLYMLADVLDVLSGSAVIAGVTVLSCDADVISGARARGAEALDTGADDGYTADVLKGIEHINGKCVNKALVIPADVPELSNEDLVLLDRAHQGGVTLCPAVRDGGTNGLVFTPPLPIDLKYGAHSFAEFCQEAQQRRIPVNIVAPPGLARDLDRPEDLLALRRQPQGNRTWRYLVDNPGLLVQE
ncbi:MAG: 2-phospho-L-lactate guanylyltransferase [Gammaproteobacteria bacterium]|nr:2-phospho-L-lactate guanylyltransferase [Gammaproteobacteria bacterium]MCY4209913.1 2-phospho-L-lactate guanylyltransferase [Gammaproteobacteria bacterium]MCY4283326.1 2-phospho-L-lactate guanylyltransferase [Gammaproteobacteria bacterium]